MGDNTGIEWTDATWNPTTGCDKVSPGCDNCYALTLAPRLKAMGSAHYQTDGDPKTSGVGFGIAMHTDALDKPLRWQRPRKIFVNSMSDLFHTGVSDEFIARVFAVMLLAPQHTFQVLTKRPGRMKSLLTASAARVAAADAAGTVSASGSRFEDMVRSAAHELATTYRFHTTSVDSVAWPLHNVWLGTSVEDQKRGDLRIGQLLDTPAAVRFLSMEPLLGPVDLRLEALAPQARGLDWVIVGGESGPGARPMDAVWVRDLRDQCIANGVPFHFKQWGSHDEHGTPMHKKLAGRLLDGCTWEQWPHPRPPQATA